jgi:uncharacterized Zn-binding protein involved in type VI secretion|uniref:Type VI secretion system PAAR protein n=1 Tax=Aliivibrio wodanis TaxID=80852 RepID=A0A5Q4YZ23_9GAMM|nr:hypothetical protein AW0309160_03610 [Aliivibrio wodanis]
MAKAVKVGDRGTDHDGFPATLVTGGSPDVKIDGMPAARVGDPLAPHSKPKHPPHGRKITSGSATVFINGKPAAITGSTISCGGVTIGNGTVNIGDITSTSQSSTNDNKYVNEPYDISIQLKNHNGEIISNFAFICTFEDGTEISKRTDVNGFAYNLATSNKSQVIKIKSDSKWLLRDC